MEIVGIDGIVTAFFPFGEITYTNFTCLKGKGNTNVGRSI